MYSTLRRAAATLAVCALAVPVFAVTAEICEDPGHGGSDPGAVGNGQQEKTNNLNTILKFNHYLYVDTNNTAGGGSWGRVLTRSSDVAVSLASRVAISNNNASNRFMSIHNNAFNSSANGTETFSYTSGSANSHNLRNHVQSRMLQAWGRVNRGNKTANFYVLKYTNAPAELAELGFIDAAVDAAYTGNATHQDTAGRYHLYATQNHYGITAFNPL